ncbi:TetR family transcriptional regulator [Phenylobacterium sp. LjRoot219]|uniref:TetR family transcriptional regulator n=1 Tax=Phenylobacterium sp. LjRoot219 TaxID=3342283 RepID=UPI003ECDDA4F
MPPATRSAAAPDIAAAARALVAEAGLRGLSLRKVAARAGVSLGAFSYQVGGKADLVRQLVVDAAELRRQRHAAWSARAQRMDLADPAVLAALIGGYLDEAALPDREHALTLSELALEAGRDPTACPEVGDLIRDEVAFWRGALDGVPGGAAHGEAIAHYCQDELPFTLAIGADPDYRLLRAAVSARLADRLRDAGTGGFAAGFEAQVAAMDARAVDIRRPLAVDADSRRARIAATVAVLIEAEGVAAVTHRAVAAAAGAPNSTVAHYFRTRDDLLRAGVEALYLGSTGSTTTEPDAEAQRGGRSLMRATRALVLAAARDDSLRPFALDLRRRRGEHMGALVAPIGGGRPLDAAAAQAAAMTISGAGFARQTLGEAPRAGDVAGLLARLRAGPD